MNDKGTHNVKNRLQTGQFWVLGLLLLAFRLGAQSEAVAVFDSGYVETGNPFVLHLSVPESYGQPTSVDFSPWSALLPPENVLGQTGWRQHGDQWVNDVSLIAFDSVEFSFPPLRVNLRNGDTLPTNPLTLQVLPTPSSDDPDGLQDIKDIHREPASWRDFLPVYGPIAAGVLLLALLIWWLLYRKKKTRLKGERILQQPPHELAWRKLAELEKRQLWQTGQLKQYYSELTYIVREYLEQRYHIPALESPSESILRQLESTPLPEPLLPPLRELLQWADLAKFAKGAPPQHYHEQALREARRLIEQTKPLEISPEPVRTTR